MRGGRRQGGVVTSREVGKDRHGERGARVVASWASGLPNGGNNWHEAKNDVRVQPGVKGGILGGLWAPKGALKESLQLGKF
jgi:hypothetical protein